MILWKLNNEYLRYRNIQINFDDIKQQHMSLLVSFVPTTSFDEIQFVENVNSWWHDLKESVKCVLTWCREVGKTKIDPHVFCVCVRSDLRYLRLTSEALRLVRFRSIDLCSECFGSIGLLSGFRPWLVLLLFLEILDVVTVITAILVEFRSRSNPSPC